jgi:tetratricopeptide (TPR) repeat protein
MRLLPLFVAAAILAGCGSSRHVRDGDRAFEQLDFESAAAAYAKAAKDDPGDAEAARKLELARRNAATARLERAAQAAASGDLDRACEEAAAARAHDPSSARAGADATKYAGLREEVKAQVEKAARAEPVEAHRILASVAKYEKTFPEIAIRLAQARDLSVRKLLAAAEDFGKAGEWQKSEASLAHAGAISAEEPQLAALVKQTRTNVRVLELIDQGWRLKAQEDLEGAYQRFRIAVELRPDAADAQRGLASARRGLADKRVVEAQRAIEDGDALAAFARVAEAEGLDPSAEGLGEVALTARAEAAKALTEMAAEAAKRKLPGMEWLRLQQARAVKPDDREIERKIQECGSKLERAGRPIVLVKGFRNATRHGGREVRLASESYRLLQQLSGNGRFATILDEDSYAVFLKDNPGLTPDIVVKATLERFDVVHQPDRRTPEFKPYTRRVSYLDITGEKYVEGTEVTRHEYVVVDKAVDGLAELSYEIYDVESRAPMSSDVVQGVLHVEDRVVAGHRESGVDEDPEELPPDATLADDLSTQLRDRLMERLRGELGWFGKKYYTSYERARDAGSSAAAVSWAVLAIRSRQAAGLSVLEEDVQWVLRRTGWDMKEGKLVAEHLK